MRAVVTAGGTSEPIDDVRVLTNLSTGRFGAAIANALAARGVEVTLLAGRALASHPEWLDPRVRTLRFGSFADLGATMEQELLRPPDLWFMAAAVSDYSPVRAEGKLRSDQDTLTLTLQRNPKLLATLRPRCGVKTFLVGFKLLSSVARETLVAVARRQLRENHLNLCVANDLAELGGEEHPVTLVTPEGGAVRHGGSRAAVAATLVDEVLRRAAVTWTRSVVDPALHADAAGRSGAASMLGLCIDAGLLPETDGNVSHRSARSGTLWTTPRQLRKSDLRESDLVFAEVDLASRRLRYAGGPKASIDASVQAYLYRAFPEVASLLHFHDGMVLPTATTGRAWPCGTLEEAEEIVGCLLRARRSDSGFAVRLVEHGWLVGVSDAARCAAEWAEARDGYAQHLREIGVDPTLAHPTPVFDGGRIVGVCARFETPTGPGWSTWLPPSQRRGGRGGRIAEALDASGRWPLVGDACAVLDWYAERGFRVARREGPFALLEPPSLRMDLRPAASVCLYEPRSGRVLLGRRLREPGAGRWAFPGGRCNPGEDPSKAGLRELHEETGITVDARVVLREATVVAGDQPGYRIHVETLLVSRADAPRATPEFDAAWVPLEQAFDLRPMTAGTRRILDAFRER